MVSIKNDLSKNDDMETFSSLAIKKVMSLGGLCWIRKNGH